LTLFVLSEIYGQNRDLFFFARQRRAGFDLVLCLVLYCLRYKIRTKRAEIGAAKSGRRDSSLDAFKTEGELPDPRAPTRVLIAAPFHRGDPDPAMQIPRVAPEMSGPRADVDQRRELIRRQHRGGLEIFDGEGSAP
jgi:hypothetical protein